MLPYELSETKNETLVAITLPSVGVLKQIIPVPVDQVVRVQSVYDEFNGLTVIVYTQSQRTFLSSFAKTMLHRIVQEERVERFAYKPPPNQGTHS